VIGIFTHLGGKSRWLDQCNASVAAALPLDANHIEQPMVKDYTEERFEALRSFPYVGFVDDDDTIEPDTIRACIDALDSTDAGIAFTLQRNVDEEGTELFIQRPAANYLDIAMHPQALHHFALIRRSAVDDEPLLAARQIGIGIDWLMKARAALTHGAVHVPMVGYNWRVYPGQDSEQKAATFLHKVSSLRDITLSWMRNNERIPVH
jgi:hypothetical protein